MGVVQEGGHEVKYGYSGIYTRRVAQRNPIRTLLTQEAIDVLDPGRRCETGARGSILPTRGARERGDISV
jgi:hypothetical protein